MTIEELPAPAQVANESAETLLQQLVGTPVKPVKLTQAPAITHLADSQAATFAATYTYRQVANVQVDLVARHDKTIIFLETNADPGKAQQASQALSMIVSHWHWQ